jgi:uncharacterized protein (DUF1697 family)
MTRYLALIRGINVGKDNALPMAQLSSLFIDAGCSDVRTYIQSGNVVFRAPDELASGLPTLIGAQLARQLGRQRDISVVLRSRDELAHAIACNPYADALADPKSVHLAFLEEAPSAARVARLDPQQSETDRFAVLGKHLYLHTPHGYGRGKLTMRFFAQLGTPCTLRNWNTVRRLEALLADG